MDESKLLGLMADQEGLVSRRQVREAELGDPYIEKRLRKKEWATVFTGVYVNHTGRLTWTQRAWAAVLRFWPAALAHQSAVAVFEAQGESTRSRTADPPGPIHVAVDHRRRVASIDGVQVHRVVGLDALVHPAKSPPVMRLEHAVLDVAAQACSEESAVAALADACQRRRTTAQRLLDALGDRPKLRRRRFLFTVLDDVATGVFSALEHRYVNRVERPHGLPTSARQRRFRPGDRSFYRDAEYVGYSMVVELDGRLGHEFSEDRWDDLDRDIESTLNGDTTLRLGWRHVEQSCRTAAVVARLLRARGWTGTLTRCGPDCTIERWADPP